MKWIIYSAYSILFLFVFHKLQDSKQTQQFQNTLVPYLEQFVQPVKQQETKTEHAVSKEFLQLLPYAANYKGNDLATFFDSLLCMSQRLSLQPIWVLKVMQHESGLNPKARNSIGATGLIQFLPETALHLGTNTTELFKTTGTRQLFYIEKFWKPVAGKIHSYADLRLYNLFPIALGQPDDFVLESPKLPASVVASRNPSFDLDGDMKITVAEFKRAIRHE